MSLIGIRFRKNGPDADAGAIQCFTCDSFNPIASVSMIVSLGEPTGVHGSLDVDH
jgi:hypothetical protein